MNKYVKYIILFVILVGIGAVGINLYGNSKLDSNSKKGSITSNKNNSESKEQEESSKQEISTISEDNATDDSVTNNNSSNNSNEELQPSKGTASSNELNDINHGTVSGSTNPRDLTVGSNNSNTNNTESDSTTDFVIDVTKK